MLFAKVVRELPFGEHLPSEIYLLKVVTDIREF